MKPIRAKMPKQGDMSDHRCAFPQCTNKINPKDDWCSGCDFYVCDEHTINLNLPFGSHDVMEHLDELNEDDPDADEED